MNRGCRANARGKKRERTLKDWKMQRGKKDLGILQKFNEVKVTVSEGYND